jgi:hypothetical protein
MSLLFVRIICRTRYPPTMRPLLCTMARDPHVQAGAELKDWDLWGPLILCLTLAILLSSQSSPANKLNPALTPADDSGLVFGAVFIVTWCGAAIVTMNAKLLGGSVSFFQSICVLGYCLFPLVLSAVACTVIHAATSGSRRLLHLPHPPLPAPPFALQPLTPTILQGKSVSFFEPAASWSAAVGARVRHPVSSPTCWFLRARRWLCTLSACSTPSSPGWC